MKLTYISLLLALIIPTSLAQQFTISGDSVFFNDSRAYISVTPHTLKSSGYITIELMSKQFSGNINLVAGFDSTNAKPKSAEYYNPIKTNITKYLECSGENTFYNYTLNPKKAYCFYNDTQNNTQKLVWEHEFDYGDITTKRIYWNEETTIEWHSISSMFNKANILFDKKDIWYYSNPINIEAGKTYTMRIWLDIIPGTEGKYDMAFYPSSLSIIDAIIQDKIYYLDPWFNTSMPYKIQENVSYSPILYRFPYLINGSSGFTLNGIQQYAWSIANTTNATNYLYYFDNTLYQLVNGSENEELPLDIEKGNTTDKNPLVIWNDYLVSYNFQECSGTNVYDSTGKYNATLMGNAVFNNSGKPGCSVSFDGSGDQLRLPDLSIFNLSGDFTIETFIYKTDTDIGYILDKFTGISTYYRFYILGNGTIYAYCSGGISTSGGNVKNNAWTYIVFRRTGNTLDIFQDGTKVNSNSWCSGTLGAPTPACIGKDGCMLGSQPNDLQGSIDTVRISLTSKSDDYIKAVFNNINSTGTDRISILSESQTLKEPEIILISPQNTTYYNYASLEFVIDSPFPVDSCWYMNDTHTNITLPNCNNLTALEYGTGPHKIKVFANTTSGIYFNSTEVNFTYSGFQISAKDEDTGELLDNVTLYISNSTYSVFLGTFNKSILLNMTNLPKGKSFIQAFHNGISRYIYLDITPTTNMNKIIYFPSQYSLYIFQLKSLDMPLLDASLTIKRYINSSSQFEIMSNTTSGINGETTFYGKPNVIYRIIASKQGYKTIEFDQILNNTQYIEITMAPDTQIPITIYKPYENISYFFIPETPFINTSNSITINITGNLLNMSKINITYLNYSNITQKIQYYYTQSTLTSFQASIPLNNPGTYFVLVSITSNNTEYNITKTYIVGNLSRQLDITYIDATGGPSVIFWKIIAFIILCMITGILFRFIGPSTLLILPIIVAILALFRFFTIGEAIIITLVSLAAIRLLSR